MRVGELYRKKITACVKDGISAKSSTFVVSFRGISSAKMNTLRKDLRRKKADVLVAKTSMARIAFKEAQLQSLADRIEGQMALVLSDSDASEISKILVKFAKDYEGFILKGGVLDGVVLSSDEVNTLSNLPSREVLLAQFMGTLNAPLTRFARALNAKTVDFASILKQKSDADAKSASS